MGYPRIKHLLCTAGFSSQNSFNGFLGKLGNFIRRGPYLTGNELQLTSYGPKGNNGRNMEYRGNIVILPALYFHNSISFFGCVV